MNRRKDHDMNWRKTIILSACGIMPLAVAWAGELDIGQCEQQFRELPMEARQLTGPLFWLHGDESQARLEMELDKVVEGGNGSFTTESRPHNDWLGPTWFRDLDICLQAAKKHGLKLWIFDEKWWPSQGVGGKVPERYAAKRLEAAVVEAEGPRDFAAADYAGDHYIAAVAGRLGADGGIEGDSLVDLAPFIHAGKLAWTVPAGHWQIIKFTYKTAPGLGQGGGRELSVDGMSTECVEWFIQTVYQPHYDHFKADFGKTIVGFFYDEPETRGDWGTDLNGVLAEQKVDWKKAYVAYKLRLSGDEQAAARFRYLEARAETWGRIMYGLTTRWCERHGVKSIGHFMEHGNMYVLQDFCAGDLMRVQKYSSMGGIDAVFSQFKIGARGGSDRPCWQTPKLGSSISHAYGKADDVTLCEIFGGRGQDLTYPEMKWWADAMQVAGVNFLIPHSFNPRAPFDGDCPPYFYNGGFEPRWPLYRVFADYTSRLSVMLSGGHHVAPVALVTPGQSAHVGKSILSEQVSESLQDALYDCDWIPYEVLENDMALAGKGLTLRNETYKILFLPAVDLIPYATLAKAKAFFDQGGVVVTHGFLPTRSATLGKTAADIAQLRDAIWGPAQPGLAVCQKNAAGGRSYLLPEKPSPEQLQQVFAGDAGIHPTLEVVEGKTDHWLHVLHRVKAGRDVFFITNQNHLGAPRSFRFRIAAAGEPEGWDAMRNEITSLPYRRIDAGTIEMEMILEPSESLLLVFQDQARQLPARITRTTKPRCEIALPAPPVAVEKTSSAKPVVVQATYGVPGDAQRSRDVRERLQKFINAGQTRLLVAQLAAGDDPAYGIVKTLSADCTVGDQHFSIKGTDTQMVFLTANPSALELELSRTAAGRHFTLSPAVASPFTGTCRLPATVDLAKSRVFLEVDGLIPEAAARVTVNGQVAGGFIGKPLRLEITRQLRPGNNAIVIEPFAPATAKLVVY
jgi:hypothetical protein